MKNKFKKIFIQIILWIGSQLKKIDTSFLSEKISNFFSRYISWIVVFIVALSMADLALLFIWPSLLPPKNIKKSSLPIQMTQRNKNSRVNFLHQSNIFHSGEIPASLKEMRMGKLETRASSEKSQPSNLPFELLGTIENFNPERSMASIRTSPKEPSLTYFVGDEIDGKARITSILRRHIKFINFMNNRLEHIEIPLENEFKMITEIPLSLSESEEKENKPVIEGLSQMSENQYKVTRSVINDHIKNLPSILRQARVEPKMSPDGEMIGHEFKWIKKGSVYESLGFQQGDTLISINGEKVNSEMEAQKLFQELRTSSQFSVKVQNKNGEWREVSYNIDENTAME